MEAQFDLPPTVGKPVGPVTSLNEMPWKDRKQQGLSLGKIGWNRVIA